MKRILIGGGFAFLTVCSTASAADLPMPAEPYVAPMAAEEPLNWTGIYVGVHGGFGGDRFEYPFDNNLPLAPLNVTGSADLTSSGWFAGGQAGFNWQMAPHWLVGIEGDIAWSDIKGELGANATLAGVLAGSGSLKAGTEIEWFGTGRGRVGFLPLEDFLIYGTGGVAFGKTNSVL